MIEEEANKLTATLCGLMTKITDEQAMIIRSELRALDFSRCKGSIEQYAGTHCDFNLAEFLGWLPGRKSSPGSSIRTREYLRAQAMEAEQLKTFWAAVNATIEAMEPAELEVHRQAALEQLDERTRALASRRELSRNRLLKGMIYQRVMAQRAG